MNTQVRVLSVSVKLAFGVGAVAEAVFFGMFNAFVTIFYNQAIGLSNSLIGAAIMLALLSDAVSDPIIGIVSDRFQSRRFGRRHPFLFLAPIPIALAVYCVFNPPDVLWQNTESAAAANQWLLFTWLVGWTIVGRLFLTFYTIPHLALGGELTREARERSRLFSYNAVFAYAAAALFSFTAWGYFLAGESVNSQGVVVPSHLNADAYGPLVFTTCGLVLCTIWICALGTFSQIPYLSAAPEKRAVLSPALFFREILSLLDNRNYRYLLLGFFGFMISVGFKETFDTFVNTYFWELKPKDIRWFGLAGLPAVITGAILAPKLMDTFDRKPVLIAALLSMAIFAQLPIDLRLLGVFPENHSDLLLPLLVANTAILAFSTAIASVAILAMLGDITDELELSTGRRQEGLVYSARAFFAKAANSFGHFVAGVGLDVFVHMPYDAVPGQVDQDVIVRLGIVSGPLMGIAALLAMIFYTRYALTKERHLEILKALDARSH
ncbi:MAG: MFS transporter [Pseudomonadota bacterium]